MAKAVKVGEMMYVVCNRNVDLEVKRPENMPLVEDAAGNLRIVTRYNVQRVDEDLYNLAKSIWSLRRAEFTAFDGVMLKIQLIKEVRMVAKNCGLKDAKDAVDVLAMDEVKG